MACGHVSADTARPDSGWGWLGTSASCSLRDSLSSAGHRDPDAAQLGHNSSETGGTGSTEASNWLSSSKTYQWEEMLGNQLSHHKGGPGAIKRPSVPAKISSLKRKHVQNTWKQLRNCGVSHKASLDENHV